MSEAASSPTNGPSLSAEPAAINPRRLQADAPPDAASYSSQGAVFERFAIRELLEKWVLYRDAGEWGSFATVWHDDGYMMATWFQGSATEFIRISREGFEKGVNILHLLGGTTIQLERTRAVAQTKMTISQRASVEGVPCDVLCTGRFYDFLEKRHNEWRIVLRRLIYEKDRLDVVDPSKTLSLDTQLLESFPVGYRHLAYLQTKIGYTVKKNLPGLHGPEVQALYGYGARWLATGSLTGAKD